MTDRAIQLSEKQVQAHGLRRPGHSAAAGSPVVMLTAENHFI